MSDSPKRPVPGSVHGAVLAAIRTLLADGKAYSADELRARHRARPAAAGDGPELRAQRDQDAARPPALTSRWNGKAERFIQTMLREWAYAIASHMARRVAPPPAWLRYNEERRHTAINYETPPHVGPPVNDAPSLNV